VLRQAYVSLDAPWVEVNREAHIFLSAFVGTMSATFTFFAALEFVGRLKSWNPLLTPAFLGAAVGGKPSEVAVGGESSELDL
jgi:hypothetical protein